MAGCCLSCDVRYSAAGMDGTGVGVKVDARSCIVTRRASTFLEASDAGSPTSESRSSLESSRMRRCDGNGRSAWRSFWKSVC